MMVVVVGKSISAQKESELFPNFVENRSAISKAASQGKSFYQSSSEIQNGTPQSNTLYRTLTYF